MKNLIFILSFAILAGCQIQNYSPELLEAFDRAGQNQAEIKKVFDHYNNIGDTLKYQAAEYLVSNMREKHCFVSFVVADSLANVIPF